jgi:ABC-type dipeptide/oligopeptide/nickel transport system ATPase component
VGKRIGCRFAGRCDFALDACTRADISLDSSSSGDHLVRCIRHAELPPLLRAASRQGAA